MIKPLEKVSFLGTSKFLFWQRKWKENIFETFVFKNFFFRNIINFVPILFLAKSPNPSPRGCFFSIERLMIKKFRLHFFDICTSNLQHHKALSRRESISTEYIKYQSRRISFTGWKLKIQYTYSTSSFWHADVLINRRLMETTTLQAKQRQKSR